MNLDPLVLLIWGTQKNISNDGKITLIVCLDSVY